MYRTGKECRAMVLVNGVECSRRGVYSNAKQSNGFSEWDKEVQKEVNGWECIGVHGMSTERNGF